MDCLSLRDPRPGRRRLGPRRLSARALTVLLGAALLLPAGHPRADAGSAAASRAASRRPLRLERGDDTGLRLAFASGDTVWAVRAARPDGTRLWELSLPGFGAASQPGRPVVPSCGAWLVVPPGTRPVVVPLSERWETTPARAMLVGLTPVARPDRESGREWLGAELLLPGETAQTGRALPAAAWGGTRELPAAGLSVGETIVWRGRRVAPVSVAPLAVDAGGRASRLLRAGAWEIRFVPSAAAGRAGGGVAAGRARRDEDMAHLFLNPEGLRRWPAQTVPSAPTRPTAGAFKMSAPLGDEVRLAVNQTRLHRVTAAGLQTAGLLPSVAVREDQIRLYQRRYNADDPAHYLEVEVPIRILGDGGDFTGGDGFLFYGLRPRDDGAWIDEASGAPVAIPGCGDPHETWNGPRHPMLQYPGNVYWLAFGDPAAGEPWARMPETELAPSAGAPLPGYRRTDTFEEDVAYREYTEDTAQDRNHWNRYTDTAVVLGLPLYAPDPAATTGSVRAGLIGFSNTTNPRDCAVALVVAADTIPVALVSTKELEEVVANSGQVITGARLAARTATLRVVRSPDSTRPLFSFLDWAEFSYDALYHADRDTLDFPTGDGFGERDVEVTGFAAPDVGLIEITAPHRPVWVALGAGNLVDAGDDWTLSLRVPHPDGASRRFLAQADVDGAGVAEFSYFNARRVTDPADPTQTAGEPDVIAVVHAGFRQAFARWAQYRASPAGGGHAVHVVDVQDLYDRFSGGLRDPWAIRRFCRYAIDHWGSSALVLVGDANENARALGVTDGTYDWVPTHLHAQQALPPPEAIPSDKWFAAPDPVDGFPSTYQGLGELLVGRFSCNNVDELNTMIDKTLAVETDQAGQAWRRRAVWAADDAWSYGYGDNAYTTLFLAPAETLFAWSEGRAAATWEEFANAAQTAHFFSLTSYLDPLAPAGAERNTTEMRELTEVNATPPLLSSVSQGAMLFRYQGHANTRVLAHEWLVQDSRASPGVTRQDVLSMSNAGRPWVFIGLGCHISDWAQNTTSTFVEPSLGEMMLTHGAAACATYGSGGYEFLDYNARFADDQLTVLTQTPPRPAGGRTRWVLGELLMAAEVRAVLRGNYVGSTYRELAAQYTLLGDPLLVLDCGSPTLSVALADEGGAALPDGSALAALDSTNVRQLSLDAVDEAGVDRVVVLDSENDDLSSAVTELPPPDPDSNQRAVYEIALPVRPFDHTVTLHVYDTSDRTPTDDHATFTVRLPQTAAIYLAGQTEPVVPGEVRFVTGVPLSFTATFGSAAWIGTTATLQLTGENLGLSGVSLARRDPRTLDVAFTAVATADSSGERAVVLTVDGYATKWVLQAAPEPLGAWQVSETLAFPNPAAGPLRFLFRTDAPPLAGRVVIYSVSGRRVATLRFGPERIDAEGRGLVPWDGRDGAGDALGNGVYLYRIELDAPNGGPRSGMQRLVMMR